MGVRDPLQPSSEVTAGEAPGWSAVPRPLPKPGSTRDRSASAHRPRVPAQPTCAGQRRSRRMQLGAGLAGRSCAAALDPLPAFQSGGRGGSNAEGRLLPPALSRTVSTGKQNALQSVPQHLPEPGCFAHSHLRLSPTAVPSRPEEHPAMCAGLCPGRSVCLQA